MSKENNKMSSMKEQLEEVSNGLVELNRKLDKWNVDIAEKKTVDRVCDIFRFIAIIECVVILMLLIHMRSEIKLLKHQVSDLMDVNVEKRLTVLETKMEMLSVPTQEGSDDIIIDTDSGVRYYKR